ncbi:dolichol-phosphate mannosyltransferase [Sporomusaceae bacterium BoRhaA]|uniref:GtrA family protein n=1 Tax=Pelorhabdus rhamnosifermentans TaxID=2772457 RepID=UPI001FE3B0D4|nr:GtrA family protein [Pelorhabdus rhamnosifermentans]MBU2699356.1 dolichol-phosphate mannosyltransferase [Pelorhabdus rhamnosifermentans]
MLMKFALVGLSGVGINMVVYMYFIALNANYLVAACCSFAVAVTNNFFWNVLWTFRGRAENRSITKKYLSFFIISSVNLAVNLLVLQLLVEYIQISETLAQLVSIALVSGLNFLLNYGITFSEKRCKQEKEASVSYEADCYTNLQ